MRSEPPRQTLHSVDEHAAEAPLPAALALHRGGGDGPVASPHSAKFRAVTATLVSVAVAAVVIAIALLARGGSGGPGPAWSSWKPQNGGQSAAREIADHLAPLYRISGVDQLTVVTVANVSSGATAASAASGGSGGGLTVAVSGTGSSGLSLLPGNTIAYNLCGIGTTDCSIGAGTPSADRLLLLRREALELALYTFKYVSGTDNVVALLPPGHTLQTSALTAKPPTGSATSSSPQPVHIALLFLRDELKPFLDEPVRFTLPNEFPPSMPQVAQWRDTAEAALVEQVTARGMFSEHLSQTQDGSNLLVLTPLAPQ
jgi:hypothetical protein